MELDHQFGTSRPHEFVENRRAPRYKLEVKICVYPRNAAVVRGQTVDISKSGISAMLRDEITIDEVVCMEIALPLGDVEVHAVARQRNPFRYGFQFLESCAAQDVNWPHLPGAGFGTSSYS